MIRSRDLSAINAILVTALVVLSCCIYVQQCISDDTAKQGEVLDNAAVYEALGKDPTEHKRTYPNISQHNNTQTEYRRTSRRNYARSVPIKPEKPKKTRMEKAMDYFGVGLTKLAFHELDKAIEELSQKSKSEKSKKKIPVALHEIK